MIKKLYIYLKSGGFVEVLKYIFTFLRIFVYYKSETAFLYLETPTSFQISDSDNKKIIFKTLRTAAELEQINFDIIKTLEFKKWFNNNSIAIIGFSNNKPVSFTWTHFNSYYLGGSIKIDLSTNKCWIGPTFVDKESRGLGINKLQIQYQLLHTPNNMKYALTSANTSNIASINSFIKLGFKPGLRFVKYYGFLNRKDDSYHFENEGEIILKFL